MNKNAVAVSSDAEPSKNDSKANESSNSKAHINCVVTPIMLPDDYRPSEEEEFIQTFEIFNKIIGVETEKKLSKWTLRITFNTAIPDSDINRASVLYDPDNPTANPTGWYSYKIVVKQNEQDYYNIYAGGAKDNFPNAQTLASEYNTFYTDADKRTWLVLSGDNINKVPKIGRAHV